MGTRGAHRSTGRGLTGEGFADYVTMNDGIKGAVEPACLGRLTFGNGRSGSWPHDEALDASTGKDRFDNEDREVTQ